MTSADKLREAKEPTDDRWASLTHWIVVFLPGDFCESVALTYDDGTRVETPESAVEIAYAELAVRLDESANNGGTPIHELEVLVFARGTEQCRFFSRTSFERAAPRPPAVEWRPTAEQEPTP